MMYTWILGVNNRYMLSTSDAPHEAVRTADGSGSLPLHVAVLHGASIEVVKALLATYEEVTTLNDDV